MFIVCFFQQDVLCRSAGVPTFRHVYSNMAHAGRKWQLNSQNMCHKCPFPFLLNFPSEWVKKKYGVCSIHIPQYWRRWWKEDKESVMNWQVFVVWVKYVWKSVRNHLIHSVSWEIVARDFLKNATLWLGYGELELPSVQVGVPNKRQDNSSITKHGGGYSTVRCHIWHTIWQTHSVTCFLSKILLLLYIH